MKPWSSARIAIYAAGLVACATVQAAAEGDFCPQLQGEYVSLLKQSQSGDGSTDALLRQLSQAQEAARQGNCNRLFFFLGPPQSRACPAIRATMNRLQRQLAGARGEGSLFQSSPEEERARLREVLLANNCSIPSTAAGRTLCVRTCDGYYFPISNSASGNRLKTDAATCQSFYAGEGQAELYVQSAGADVDQAVSSSGKRYADQPFAFLYRQTYDAACHAELKTGIAALEARYLNAPVKAKSAATAAIAEPPDLVPVEADATDAKIMLAAQPTNMSRPVRYVGAAYYADLFAVSAAQTAGQNPLQNLRGTAIPVVLVPN